MGSYEQVSELLFIVATTLYFISVIGYFYDSSFKSNVAGGIATGIAILGVISHTASLGYRWAAIGHSPTTDMYEYGTLFAYFAALSYIIIQFYTKNRSFGGFAMAIAFLLMGMARLFYAEPKPLVPALQSFWLEIHVFTAVISSGALSIAFLFGVLYLLKERKERRGLPAGGVLSSLPKVDVLDNLAYRTTAFAFPLWTVAILAGGIWAEEAWGRYWGWDPKETWSFITWLIYAGYLHARATAGWRGRSAAILSGIGFVGIVFTFIGVNIWLSGLHSYG